MVKTHFRTTALFIVRKVFISSITYQKTFYLSLFFQSEINVRMAEIEFPSEGLDAWIQDASRYAEHGTQLPAFLLFANVNVLIAPFPMVLVIIESISRRHIASLHHLLQIVALAIAISDIIANHEPLNRLNLAALQFKVVRYLSVNCNEPSKGTSELSAQLCDKLVSIWQEEVAPYTKFLAIEIYCIGELESKIFIGI